MSHPESDDRRNSQMEPGDYVVARRQDKGIFVASCSAFQGPHLSAGAKGTLAYLLSLPPTWRLQVARVEEDMGYSAYARRKFFRELLDQGYMDRYPRHSENGDMAGWVFEYGDEPMRDTRYLQAKARKEQRRLAKKLWDD